MKDCSTYRRRSSRYLPVRLGFVFLLTVLAIGVSGLLAATVRCAELDLTPAMIDRVRSSLVPLDLSQHQEFSPQQSAFFRYYGLDSGQAAHLFGAFDSDAYRLAAHVYLPSKTVGTVFLLHGFFDHSGIFKHLIRRCVEEDFAVAIFDLPGHGLSSGDAGDISDFAQYAAVVSDFVRVCSPALPRPFHLVGHSTGAAIAIEILLNDPHRRRDFERVVLAAPLVHHRFHRISRAQMSLIKPFVDDLPRRYHRNSSDVIFVEWLKLDPLQGRRISLNWLTALYAWNDRLDGYTRQSGPVLILQGTEDSVVDWRYNLAVLQSKFTDARLVRIEGARHQLFNETPAIRSKVLQAVIGFLTHPELPKNS